MSNELYYRGSSSYEVAVKNRFDRLERSGERNSLAILNGLQNMEYGIRSDIRESTYAIVASQKTLAKIYQQGFDAVNNTLDFGFQMVASGLNGINNSINAMSEAICNKLDEIHDIVNNPRLTAARELFRRASTNFEKGYYEEALEDCKQAVEKEKTDFISWYLLGQIYLFGAGKYSNVINLPEAETALTNAAKYIDADIDSSEEAQKLAAQIYYYLGQAKYFLSNDLFLEGKSEESSTKLEEAEKAAKNSDKLRKNDEVLYNHAKYLHYLGKRDEALEDIELLIGKDPIYALRVSTDKNFETIWPQIDAVIEKNRQILIARNRELLKNISCPEKVNEIIYEAHEKVKTVLLQYDSLIKKIENKKEEFPSQESVKQKYLQDIKTGKENFEKDVEPFDSEILSATEELKNLNASLTNQDYIYNFEFKKDVYPSCEAKIQEYVKNLEAIVGSRCNLMSFDSKKFDDDFKRQSDLEYCAIELKILMPFYIGLIKAHDNGIFTNKDLYKRGEPLRAEYKIEYKEYNMEDKIYGKDFIVSLWDQKRPDLCRKYNIYKKDIDKLTHLKKIRLFPLSGSFDLTERINEILRPAAKECAALEQALQELDSEIEEWCNNESHYRPTSNGFYKKFFKIWGKVMVGLIAIAVILWFLLNVIL